MHVFVCYLMCRETRHCICGTVMKRIDKILLVLCILLLSLPLLAPIYAYSIGDFLRWITPYPEKYPGAVYSCNDPVMLLRVTDDHELTGTITVGNETVELSVTHGGRDKSYIFFDRSKENYNIFVMEAQRIKKNEVLLVMKDHCDVDKRFKGLFSEILLKRAE